MRNKRAEFSEDEILFALMQYLEPFENESKSDFYLRIITTFISEVYVYDDKLVVFYNISGADGKLKSADLDTALDVFDQKTVSSTTLIAGRTPLGALVALPYGFVLAVSTKGRL